MSKMFASCYYILYLWGIEIKKIITTLKTKIMKATLTTKEIETLTILVRLGDSKELALKTVLNERGKDNSTDFYRNAYEN